MTDEQKAALQRAAIARATAKKPRTFGETVYENVIGSGEIDTPGERLGATIKDSAKSLGSGVARGAMGLVTLPQTLGGLMDAGVEKAFGIPAPQSALPDPGAMANRAVRETIGGYQPQTTAGEYAGTVGEYLPGIAMGGTLPQMVAGGLGSELAGQMTEGTAAEPWARVGGGLAGGIAAGALESAAARSAATKSFIKANSSTKKLFDEADALYTQGHARNVQIQPNETARLAANIRRIATDRGLISPTGKVIDNPGVNQALNWLDDFQGGAVNTQQMQSLRSILNDIAAEPKKSIAKAGVDMKKAFDDFLEPFAPEFKPANALKRRAMLGAKADELQELALDTAENYTQSGLDNALRQEFRTLNRRIIKGKEKGLRPDQVEAVSKATGTNTPHAIARYAGKVAPRGPMTYGLAGAPAAAGLLTGNPALGLAASGLLAGTGYAGQALSTMMRNKNVQMAAAALRSGQPLQLPSMNVPLTGLAAMGVANAQ